MRTIVLILLFVSIFAHLANAETYRKVCNGSTCRMVRVVESGLDISATPTPAAVESKPVEIVAVKAPVRSVLANPAQATRTTVHAVRYHRAGPFRNFRLFGR
jgi:hypothetical protein